MRVRPLDVGLEAITRWNREDEAHLPQDGTIRPSFLPHDRPLDEILRPPSLDERLASLLQPEGLDPDLMLPGALGMIRQDVAALFARQALRAQGRSQDMLERASRCLAEAAELDDDIRGALAALLRA